MHQLFFRFTFELGEVSGFEAINGTRTNWTNSTQCREINSILTFPIKLHDIFEARFEELLVALFITINEFRIQGFFNCQKLNEWSK